MSDYCYTWRSPTFSRDFVGIYRATIDPLETGEEVARAFDWDTARAIAKFLADRDERVRLDALAADLAKLKAREEGK